jgi:hypothetical protein
MSERGLLPPSRITPRSCDNRSTTSRRYPRPGNPPRPRVSSHPADLPGSSNQSPPGSEPHPGSSAILLLKPHVPGSRPSRREKRGRARSRAASDFQRFPSEGSRWCALKARAAHHRSVFYVSLETHPKRTGPPSTPRPVDLFIHPDGFTFPHSARAASLGYK